MSHLVLEGLGKSYGSAVAVEALDLSVERGEFVSLLGPSGCGKTTTLQMIAGFVPVDRGRILLDGGDLVAVPPNKRGLGIVFQSYALFPHMTVAENIAFGLEMRGIDKAERETRTLEAMALVGLKGFADRYPKRMSGGQQQRVALARALVIKPALLLLDEPLSNLDAKLREEMQSELRQIQRSIGTTTILVTHDQHEAMALSDRIVLMNQGRVEQIGAPDAVYGKPASAFVASFLGKTNVLRGTGDGSGAVSIGAFTLPIPGAGTGPVQLAVRPERLHLAAAGAPGFEARVTSRVFQGAHWLLTADSAAGPLILMRHNDGQPVPAEGETVTLSFAPSDAALLAPGDAR
ncbi:ABC transporter ATP-binding protein [Bosea psychrotolerans]|uniref:Putative spermidine/putrescine transport system ATP-binding protein n=1 Tax=Bosea psychrotolerans TaxID=1871628 RepID=A0A2S4MB36_9HYPH|nr:ABC transporter ATP-binding protein [Bosea psychrotolerans]POR51829.1 putative spermidine/putrescine transport system ATP-binding protein [Bosea psychrotolerans]